jgi:hypothetical protein
VDGVWWEIGMNPARFAGWWLLAAAAASAAWFFVASVAVIGLVRLAKTRPQLALLFTAYILAIVAPPALTIGGSRFHAPLVPAVVFLAAAGLPALGEISVPNVTRWARTAQWIDYAGACAMLIVWGSGVFSIISRAHFLL